MECWETLCELVPQWCAYIIKRQFWSYHFWVTNEPKFLETKNFSSWLLSQYDITETQRHLWHPVAVSLKCRFWPVHDLKFPVHKTWSCHQVPHVCSWVSGMRTSKLLLHDVRTALYALTGCDTKISTKLAALTTIHIKLSLVHNFNSSMLTESLIQMAETFLVKCFKPTTDLKTFYLLGLMAFPSNGLWENPSSPESMQESISTTGVVDVIL